MLTLLLKFHLPLRVKMSSPLPALSCSKKVDLCYYSSVTKKGKKYTRRNRYNKPWGLAAPYHQPQ